MVTTAAFASMTTKQKELNARIERGRSNSKKRAAVTFVGDSIDQLQCNLTGDREPTKEEEAAAYSRASFQPMKGPNGVVRNLEACCKKGGVRLVDPLNDRDFHVKRNEIVAQSNAQKIATATEDVCCTCGEPHNEKVKDQTLMRCETVVEGIKFCGVWAHPGCVGRDAPPKDDWLCHNCANDQQLQLNLTEMVGVCGLELETEAIDEDGGNKSEDDSGGKHGEDDTAKNDDQDAESLGSEDSIETEDGKSTRDDEFVAQETDDEDDDDDDFNEDEVEDEGASPSSKKQKQSPQKKACFVAVQCCSSHWI